MYWIDVDANANPIGDETGYSPNDIADYIWFQCGSADSEYDRHSFAL